MPSEHFSAVCDNHLRTNTFVSTTYKITIVFGQLTPDAYDGKTDMVTGMPRDDANTCLTTTGCGTLGTFILRMDFVGGKFRMLKSKSMFIIDLAIIFFIKPFIFFFSYCPCR